MENSFKIVSIHADDCYDGCPNRSACYLQKRKHKENINPHTYRMTAILSGYSVYEAICSLYPGDTRLDLVRRHPNYNLTISCKIFDRTTSNVGIELSFLPIKQLQISCYDYIDLVRFREYQKLFLIKDEDTFLMYKQLQKDTRIEKVHFTIDLQWLSIDKLKEIVEVHNSSPLHGITLDSCLSNWIVNGKCMYTTTYVDLNRDKTFRKCPFKLEGIPINDLTIEEMISFSEPCTCKYQKFFNEGVS